jgi:CO/xanthine dehydrogenase FAD-binding subunit
VASTPGCYWRVGRMPAEHMEQIVRPFRCIRPSAVPEAIGLLQEYGADAIVLAGGTDLIVGLRDGAVAPRVVVDVKGARDLPPLITKADCFLTVAATVAMSEIESHEIVRTHFPALAEAAAVVGSIQIRNRATLVGNVCNASPAADTVPVLAVYGALVKVVGPSGERLVPVVDFIQGNRRTALTGGEIAVALYIPFPDRPFGAAFARITRRRGVDLATVNLCCGVDDAGVTTFAFGAVSPRPLLVRDASGALADPSAKAEAKTIALDAMIAEASPITDVRGSAEYRLAMLGLLARRAQLRAAARLSNGKADG